MASGYEMKAKPAPLFTTAEISSTFMLKARLPKMPKIVMPAIRLVNVSNVVTINTSLFFQGVHAKKTFHVIEMNKMVSIHVANTAKMIASIGILVTENDNSNVAVGYRL